MLNAHEVEFNIPNVDQSIKETKCYQYALSVLDGRVVACRQVILACKRFFEDLDNPLFLFSINRYKHAVDFMETLPLTLSGSLKHTETKNLILEPWQHFIVGNIYGFFWASGDSKGYRRFSRSYITIPRKNGKSKFASACAQYAIFADGEHGARVYSAATVLSQAKIVFDESVREIRQSKILNKRVVDRRPKNGEIQIHNSQNFSGIYYNGNIYKPLSWNPKGMEGLNAHFAIIDEYHVHDTNGMYDVLRLSMGARPEPHLMAITTAGSNLIGPARLHQNFCELVLEKTLSDDSLFILIYTLDEGDDWTNEDMWAKANPNLGVSTSIRKLREDLTEALQQPDKEFEFKTKLLNIWCENAMSWVSGAVYDECSFEEEELAEGMKGECYGSLDLSSRIDFTSFSLFWPDSMTIKTWYFLPHETMMQKTDDTGIAIREWYKQGYIIGNSGNVVDYGGIKVLLEQLREEYDIVSIDYDRHNSSQIILDLEDMGFKCYGFGQGYNSMSEPTKELQAHFLEKNIKFVKNPVNKWQLSNVVITMNPAGDVKIDKSKTKNKVDGPITWVMCIGAWIEEMKRRQGGEMYAISIK